MTHHIDPSPPAECVETQRHLEAHLDGELQDAELSHRIRQHLAECETCGAESRALAALEEGLRRLPREEPPARLLERLEVIEGTAMRGRDAKRRPVRTPWLMVAACVLALMALPLALHWWTSPGSSASGLDTYVDDHLASLQPSEAVQIETGDPFELERWYTEHLPFAPRLPRWSSATLVSGRLCLINGQRVARVQYLTAQTPLSLFITPQASASVTESTDPSLMAMVRGCCVIRWHRDGLEFVLVGPAESSEAMERLGEEARQRS